ncbi:MAG: FUSC family protein [bacterium]
MRFRRATHTIRSATSIAAARPAYAAGIRASIATVVPLALAHLLDRAGAGTWMSLGGFNGALSDRGGSYGTRAWTMSGLMAGGAAAAALGAVVGGHIVPALIATFVVAFFASVLRVWGNPGISIGGGTLTVYVVSLAIPAEYRAEAIERAGFLVLGGLWAMGIALVLWPLRPYRPARVAIAGVYSALADYVEQLAAESTMKITTEWPVAFTPAHTTSMRTALENAAAVLVQLRRGRPGSVERGERLLVLAESADQLFGHCVAFGETLAALRTAGRHDALHDICIELLRDVAATARSIAIGVETETTTAPIPVTWSGEQLRGAIRRISAEPIDPQYDHAAMILDRAAQFASAASVTVEVLNGGKPDADALAAAHAIRSPASEEPKEERALWDSFRAMLAPGSLIVRFALRVAVVTTIAVALTETLELKRGYWVTITVIVILQPYTGVTLTRAIQRVLGTVLGALLAAALGALFHDPRAILVIATIFVACCVALLPINYAAFSVFLTPTFVLLAEASAGDWHLAGTRVMNTLLGGALALGGARFLWPSPERTRFPAYAAAALRANGAYLSRVIELYDDRSDQAGESMRALRRAIGLATVNAEESLQRALTEAHGDERKLAPALTFLTYTRRLTASTAALAISRHVVDGSARAKMETFRREALAALEDLAAALETSRAPASALVYDVMGAAELPPLARPRIDRLARQIATLHDAVARMTPAASPEPATESHEFGTVLAPRTTE